MAVTTEGGSVDPGPDGQGDDTPFDASPRPRAPRRRRTVLVTVALVAAVAGLVVIAVRSLGDASLFFLNADEAVAQREELGDDRFRLQGTVVPDSVVEEDGTVSFEVVYADTVVEVTHQGDPPELFQPGIPVVLEGQWDGSVYASDRILVRHSSEYEADHGDRLDDAGDQPPPTDAAS